jgi:tetraacyldisaccharide 4'-kinase
VGSLLDLALWPAEQVYRAVVFARNRAYDRGVLRSARGPLPVVCIGNLGVGGSGKTPLAAWLAGRLARAGHTPAVLLRGYGSDEVRVHRDLNPSVPVIAARRRLDGVREAAAMGCTIVVMDDGFQHRALARDVDVVLVSVEGWVGSRPLLLPRGPWREPVGAARRAHVVVATRRSAPDEVAERAVAELRARVGDVPVVRCEIVPAGLVGLHGGEPVPTGAVRGLEVLAVAALAQPGPFVVNLQELGMAPELHAFPDHHEFTAGDAERVRRLAGDRPMVMTLKDAVKLRELLPADAAAYVLRQDVQPSAELESVLDRLMVGSMEAPAR